MHIELPETAVGAVYASVIAAAVTLIGLVISKEQKVSDLRQAWIDALRSDATATVAHFLRFTQLRGMGNQPYVPACMEAVTAFRSADAAVRLRLNMKERPSQAIVEKLDHLVHLIRTGDADEAKAEAGTAEIVTAVQRVLKTEWERVKRGEIWFRALKYGAILILVAAAFWWALGR